MCVVAARVGGRRTIGKKKKRSAGTSHIDFNQKAIKRIFRESREREQDDERRLFILLSKERERRNNILNMTTIYSDSKAGHG